MATLAAITPVCHLSVYPHSRPPLFPVGCANGVVELSLHTTDTAPDTAMEHELEVTIATSREGGFTTPVVSCV